MNGEGNYSKNPDAPCWWRVNREISDIKMLIFEVLTCSVVNCVVVDDDASFILPAPYIPLGSGKQRVHVAIVAISQSQLKPKKQDGSALELRRQQRGRRRGADLDTMVALFLVGPGHIGRCDRRTSTTDLESETFLVGMSASTRIRSFSDVSPWSSMGFGGKTG